MCVFGSGVKPTAAAIGKTLLLWLLALPVLVGGCSDAPPPSDHYYAGKRIDLIIPTSPGGSTDRFGRLIGEGLQRFVPGNPVVIPRQMTGGGGVLASNWVIEQAPKDGTVLLVATGQDTLQQLLGQQGVRTRPEDFSDLVALPTVRLVTIAAGKGVKEPTDVVQLRGGEDLYTALIAPSSGISFILQAKMLELPLEIVSGYAGGKDRDLAMFRGEIDIIQQVKTTFASSTQPLLDRGAVLLWNDGLLSTDGKLVRDPAMPSIPTFEEVYTAATGEPPSGQVWDLYKAIIPLIGNAAKVVQIAADAPPEAKRELMTGIRAMAADPEFSKQVREESKGHDVLYGEELQKVLVDARKISPEQIALIREYISEYMEVEYDE